MGLNASFAHTQDAKRVSRKLDFAVLMAQPESAVLHLAARKLRCKEGTVFSMVLKRNFAATITVPNRLYLKECAKSITTSCKGNHLVKMVLNPMIN